MASGEEALMTIYEILAYFVNHFEKVSRVIKKDEIKQTFCEGGEIFHKIEGNVKDLLNEVVDRSLFAQPIDSPFQCEYLLHFIKSRYYRGIMARMEEKNQFIEIEIQRVSILMVKELKDIFFSLTNCVKESFIQHKIKKNLTQVRDYYNHLRIQI